MTCEERKEQIGLYATNALDPGEQSELRAHLQSGCPACNGYLAEVESILDLLPLALNPVDPGASVKRRLLNRIAQPPNLRLASSGPPERQRRPGRFLDALIGGAIAAALGTLAVWVLLNRNQRELDSLRNQVARQEAQVGLLQNSVQNADERMHLLQSPSVQVVSAEGTPAMPAARARVFLDHSRGNLYLFATALNPPGTGKTYELWLINDKQQKIPAGTFEVNKQGEASLQRSVPADYGKLVAVAVTDEPAGGSLRPTGAIQILGKVQ